MIRLVQAVQSDPRGRTLAGAAEKDRPYLYYRHLKQCTGPCAENYLRKYTEKISRRY